MISIINTLKSKRKNKKLSVRELGKIANVSYTVIYDMENKGVLPKFETLEKLTKALELKITYKINKRTTKTQIQETLETILFKKGLHAKDIKEIKQFIQFKIMLDKHDHAVV